MGGGNGVMGVVVTGTGRAAGKEPPAGMVYGPKGPSS